MINDIQIDRFIIVTLITSFVLTGCKKGLWDYAVRSSDYEVPRIKHKGQVYKEDIIEYAVQEIASHYHSAPFDSTELSVMPNLRYRIVFPEIKVSVVSEFYLLTRLFSKEPKLSFSLRL